MMRICIIQPILTNYRMPVFRELAERCQIDVLFSPMEREAGFGSMTKPEIRAIRLFAVPTVRPFGQKIGMYQMGIARYIVRNKPEAIIIFANLRYLSFWTTLVLAKIAEIPVYAHGHGMYKKARISTLYRLMIKTMLRLVTSYIGYAPIVRDSFIAFGFSADKVTVAHNSATNPYTVQPKEKTGQERGILFIGRLRRGSNLRILIRVLRRLQKDDGLSLILHVVGAGEEELELRGEMAISDDIVWHGEVYNSEVIRQISQHCFVGCYPGNAGLSVVHMMSLSLPVVTHDDMRSHQGPEPSFVRNGVSGILFDHLNPEESLYQALRLLATDAAAVHQMREAAFEEYQRLVNPSLAARLWAVLVTKGKSPGAFTCS